MSDDFKSLASLITTKKNHCVGSIEWDEQHQKEEIAMPAGKKKKPPVTNSSKKAPLVIPKKKTSK